jgi:hypothetical protein
MTLIVCTYVPTGIVLAGDSRTTAVRQQQQVQNDAAGNPSITSVQTPWVLSDSARKVFSIHNRYSLGLWGDAFVNEMPIAHHINDFALTTADPGFDTPDALADALLAHFGKVGPALKSGFVVAGYSGTEPFVIELDLSKGSKNRRNWNVPENKPSYGCFYGGDWDIVARLFSKPEMNPPFNLLNLQDAVDLSQHLMRTTIDQLRFEPRFPTVGGHIDIITSTPVRTRFLARKELRSSEAARVT